MKNNKGITLIALVITIVVLIILAGVAISLSLGENGIFNKAKLATESYANEQAKEEAEIAEMTGEIIKQVVGDIKNWECKIRITGSVRYGGYGGNNYDIQYVQGSKDYTISYIDGDISISPNTSELINGARDSWGKDYYNIGWGIDEVTILSFKYEGEQEGEETEITEMASEIIDQVVENSTEDNDLANWRCKIRITGSVRYGPLGANNYDTHYMQGSKDYTITYIDGNISISPNTSELINGERGYWPKDTYNVGWGIDSVEVISVECI